MFAETVGGRRKQAPGNGTGGGPERLPAPAPAALDRPVLVVGTPRSGKTCVWSMLAESSDFVGVCEPLAIWHLGAAGRASDRWTAEHATPEVVSRIRTDCAAIAEQAGGRRYLDNLAYHALRLPFVRAVMPEALIIHVVRDPIDGVPESYFGWTNRDTVRRSVAWRWRHLKIRALPGLAWRFARNYVASRTRGVRETWGPRPPGLPEFVASHGAAEIAAWQWAEIVNTTLADLEEIDSLQVLQVRYEDLVSFPRREAERVCEFAGVTDREPVIDFAVRRFQKDYVHHEPNRREISESDWKIIMPMLMPVRIRLGYTRGGDRS